MTPILWMKFPDDAIAGKSFSESDKRALENVFGQDGAWPQSLSMLGLTYIPAQMIQWRNETPYINWTAYLNALTGGLMRPARSADNNYILLTHYSWNGVIRMMKAQWSISRYMRRPATAGIADSLALGVVLQSLIMRLGRHAPNLAQYLADPGNAPASIRRILRDIQMIQMRRTEMSAVWNDVLPQTARDAGNDPEFFWDDGQLAPKQETTQSTSAWKGQSVCAGAMTGIALAVDTKTNEAAIKALKEKHNAPVILVFRAARPETTLLFPFADALIFAEGGVLSHACTIARESNIPAITGVGKNCYEAAKAWPWLMMDGKAGTVIKI